MPEPRSSSRKDTATSQIVGFRIPGGLAREIKSEAARRGLKLNQLLVEMWKELRPVVWCKSPAPGSAGREPQATGGRNPVAIASRFVRLRLSRHQPMKETTR